MIHEPIPDYFNRPESSLVDFIVIQIEFIVLEI
jgi:hypothetical protein